MFAVVLVRKGHVCSSFAQLQFSVCKGHAFCSSAIVNDKYVLLRQYMQFFRACQLLFCKNNVLRLLGHISFCFVRAMSSFILLEQNFAFCKGHVFCSCACLLLCVCKGILYYFSAFVMLNLNFGKHKFIKTESDSEQLYFNQSSQRYEGVFGDN